MTHGAPDEGPTYRLSFPRTRESIWMLPRSTWVPAFAGTTNKVTAVRDQLIVPLLAAEATDANRFGPKAANLARLGRAGLPIPDGFCIDAQAYRLQVAALGLADFARDVSAADAVTARRAALAMKLRLLDKPIVPEVLDPLL